MNEVQVSLDDVGRVQLRRAGGDEGVYTLETTEALRAFFQAERDEQLGRWRDPENPDYVAYPGSVSPDWVVVLDESTGRADVVFKQRQNPPKDSAFTLVAERYFAAHPQPKPWVDAKPGEVWALTYAGIEETAWVADFTWGAPPRFRQFKNLLNPIFTNDKHITAGRRIWPEGEASE